MKRPAEDTAAPEEEPAAEEAKPKKPKVSASVRNKRKERRAKGLHKKAPEPRKTRDFATDLRDYLEKWETRDEEESEWKFNKILQAWAVANCTKEHKIDEDLFALLLPYLDSIQGGGRDRMKEMLRDVVELKVAEEEAPAEGEEEAVDEAEKLRRQLKALQRAQSVLLSLSS